MPKSVRVRTQIGVDKSVQVDLNQDFDFLEILSLQFTESEIYTRMCADYGVIVGRVSVNRGYGIPNAKVSVFIPLTTEDENNPVVTELYPYKTTNEVTEEGYKYNLLPKVQSYSNHVPTGSFPNKGEVLKNQSWVEVYEKYYKFTVTTNQSGDFMIFGVPLGLRTVVMNVDLSDIGEFSQTPQDLIRMGRASEGEIDGTKFRASNNLDSLPQIVRLEKQIEVGPLWGDPTLCQASITRTDFDLSEEDINIQPTAIFLGSMVSTLDKYALKKYKNDFCRAKLKLGELCSLTSGPGEILAIRQTIFNDTNGRPILEQYVLEQGGKVIDENGAWMVELPMNMDYVFTNEYGQQVLSLDPSIGIPTKSKYRFKVKWQQSDDSLEDIRRAYFLVPNVREYGWNSANLDPYQINANDQNVQKSYAFSLDWADYGVTGTTIGNQMINDAINCEDKFYEFYYNKVYTVSQLIDQYRGGKINRRYNSIKNILDDTCEDTTNKFPTNDAQFRPDFIYLVFSIFLRVFTPVLFVLLIIQHVLGFLLWILCPVLYFIACVISPIVYVICQIVNGVKRLLGGSAGKCQSPAEQCRNAEKILELPDKLKYLALPNLSYPDCETCNCTVESGGYGAQSPFAYQTVNLINTNNYSYLSDWNSSAFYDKFQSELGAINDSFTPAVPQTLVDLLPPQLYAYLSQVLAGRPLENPSGTTTTSGNYFYEYDAFVPTTPLPYINAGGFDVGWRPIGVPEDTIKRRYFSTSLPMHAKFNLFNLKAKYFNQQVGNATFGASVYQGPNQIKVKFNYSANTAPNQFHYDNLMILSCDAGLAGDFKAGTMFTTVAPNKTFDVNSLSASTANDLGLPSITGTSVVLSPNNIPITVQFANPASPSNSLSVNYNIYSSSADTEYHRFPIDVEYFQVITAMTIAQYLSIANTNAHYNSFTKRVVLGEMILRLESGVAWYGSQYVRPDFWTLPRSKFGDDSYPIFQGLCNQYMKSNTPPFAYWERVLPVVASTDGPSQILVFAVRGVDPYSTRNLNSYDLNRLFGFDYGSNSQLIFTGKYKLNIPVQPGLKCARHIDISSPTSISTYSNSGIFYQNFNYQPSLTDFSGFTSDLIKYYSSLDASPLFRDTANPAGFPNGGVGAWGIYPYLATSPNQTAAYFDTTKGLLVKGWNNNSGNLGGPGPDVGVLFPSNNAWTTNLFTAEINYHYYNPTSVINTPGTDSQSGFGYGAFAQSVFSNNYGTCSYNSFPGFFDPRNGDFPDDVHKTYFDGLLADGWWLFRRNDNQSGFASTPTCNNNIANYGYSNRGYYSDESVEGGELFHAKLQGKPLDKCAVPGWFPLNAPWYVFPGGDEYDDRFYFCKQKYYDTLKFYVMAPSYINGFYGINVYPWVIDINNAGGPQGVTFSTATSRYTVMRSDRLPTSDRPTYQQAGGGTMANSWPLHSNPKFALYIIDDQGVITAGPPVAFGGGNSIDSSITADTPSQFSSVIESLNDCGQMLPLNCYYNQPISSSGATYYTIQLDQNRSWKDGTCTEQSILGLGDRPVFKTGTGCYLLVSRFILSIPLDIILLLEWKSRIDITFGACRNVFSHLFTNNWINGVLYAYPFKNEKTYFRNNTLRSVGFCTDTVMQHTPTNSHYYRSSPWNYTSSKFVGKKNQTSSDGGNKNYLNCPVTILDLGPKTDYLQELVLNDNFDGYVAGNLPESTFKDNSDILNLLIISRLLNTNFLEQLVGVKGAGILGYFSRRKRDFLIQNVRQKNMVDGDYAQLISINSELGVQEFEAENYPFADSIFYYPGADSEQTAIGIFFASNNQIRDFVSPRRKIYNENFPPSSFRYEYIPKVKTQLVPFYTWEIKPKTSPQYIFGSQQNDWESDNIVQYKYQSLDRFNNLQLSNYMTPVNVNLNTSDFRGYIFGINPIGGPGGTPVYDPLLGNKKPFASPPAGYQNPSAVTVGGPFYFYFGLIKGGTAIDKFKIKYVQEDLI